MSEYTNEQKDLMNKPKIVILPSFNDEWVIEVFSQADELEGRFNAVDVETAVEAIQAALTNRNDPPHFDIN